MNSHDAFELLLVMAAILAYPQFGEGVEVIVETDASTSEVGAILSQKQDDGCLHPIAYASGNSNQPKPW